MRANAHSTHLVTDFDDENPDRCPTSKAAPTRGILWVLRWAAAVAVLAVSCGVLAEFAYCVVAEQTVARAARAGALEATLPRANIKSVTASITRQLICFTYAEGQTRLVIHRNGRPVLGRLIAQPEDRISVQLSLPSATVLPRWLHAVKFWRGNAPIEVRAERIVPGRRLVQTTYRRDR
jgi:hypothetical protein